MSGAYLLGIITLVCVSDLLIALWLSKMPDRSRDVVGAAPKTGTIDPIAARRFSRIMFIAAPLMWLFFAALTFGLFGPVKNITPITF